MTLNYGEAKRAAIYDELLAKHTRGEYVTDHQLEEAAWVRDNMLKMLNCVRRGSPS